MDDDVEALRDRCPLRRSSGTGAKMDLVDTESCGGGIRFLAPSPIVWGYIGIYRRKEYIGGALRRPRGRGRALHPRDLHGCSLEQGPSLLDHVR